LRPAGGRSWGREAGEAFALGGKRSKERENPNSTTTRADPCFSSSPLFSCVFSFWGAFIGFFLLLFGYLFFVLEIDKNIFARRNNLDLRPPAIYSSGVLAMMASELEMCDLWQVFT
jgi:hypothetical protein